MEKLSDNSTKPLNISPGSTLNFNCEISGTNVRWESITLALIAAGRATTDIPFFPPLYTSRLELRTLQRAITELSDRCLEIMLGLDSLNDIQLICQYENFILHSVMDGDQSYSAWRRLGDVIGSLLFLGLHERIADMPMIPGFLAELRRSIFAQIYSDDKNMAVFLGRPPRLSRKFCCFQLSDNNRDTHTRNPPRPPMAALDHTFFGSNDRIDQVTGLRWTACRASLKEEIMEVLHEHGGQSAERVLRFDAIYACAQSLWRSLPGHLRLERTLFLHRDRSPFENDFLLNTRLTYIQTLFLLRNSVANHENAVFAETEVELLRIPQEMLSLTVEAIILRDHLVNSGTSLLWKVAHYGPPAAGVIYISMLRPTFWQPREDLCIPKMLQDLGVFASEIGLGGLLQEEAPNYDLVSRAANTIQRRISAALSCGGAFTDLRVASE
ncbi:uncharacterized protein A1O5_06060 [Cladophialophora psammophila CBS 110553]|uniref:Transcription factor domain-containing protein n=1 Tax=Cladophialophora psammophila CBS 110553 TaxID=1182543 RepID=W9WS85_9EURO|nr:uncharacterized protein A1O5_06060 [Cladophialophora psammophila CBS 110553]EXJ71067.1 hypothetical protein A1O5_06060 [Cladophialophora psammophila CBS 110553]